MSIKRFALLIIFSLIFGLCSLDTILHATPVSVKGIKILGAQRSKKSWIVDYINLSLPCLIDEQDLIKIKEKLQTTQVFQTVEVYTKAQADGSLDLILELEEKWTTIPVLRAALGGGTPLLVAGLYDTHGFGKLWTFGAEVQRYGDAPPGGVIWARAPRWLDGSHYLNLEFWKENKLRTIYNDSLEPIAEIDSRATMINAGFRLPTPLPNISLGIEWSSRMQQPTRIRERGSLSLNSDIFKVNTGNNTLNKGTLNLVFDDISISNILYKGHRLAVRFGPIFYQDKLTQIYDIEYFYYYIINNSWNFAFHSSIGSASDSSLQNLRFLGGFESIRGLPDGALYGRNAVFNNIELRHLSFKLGQLWVQSVLFADSGFASDKSLKAEHRWRSSTGFGFRFAVPKVNRMMFRIDYAWSTDNNKVQGITAGMNQFFQPYKPL